MKTNRIEWIDMMRGIGMFLVICGHVFKPAGLNLWVKWIYSFHMPMFFMISGAVCYIQSQNKEYFNPEKFISKKIQQIIIPYLCLNFIALPLWFFNYKILDNAITSVSMIIKGIFTSINGPANPMWYVVVLAQVTFIFYAIQKIAHNKLQDIMFYVIIIFCGGCIFKAKVGTAEVALHWNLVYIALLFYGLGYLFMAQKKRLIDKWLAESSYKRYSVMAISIGLGTVASFLNVKISMYSDSFGNAMLFAMSALGIPFGLLLLAEKLPTFRLIEYVGQNSIVYLAFHISILRTFQKFSVESNYIVENHPLILSLFIFVALIPICIFFNKYMPIVVGKRKKVGKVRGE